MDIDLLLRRAAESPLGPFKLTVTASGAGSWELDVKLGDGDFQMRAENDPNADALLLIRHVPAQDAAAISTSAARAHWVIETSPSSAGGLDVKLWLHGDGLGAALLVNALVELAHIAPPVTLEARDEPAAPAEVTPDALATVDEEPSPLLAADEPGPALPPIKIPVITEPEPQPVPVSSPHGVTWRSFTSGSTSPAAPLAAGATEDHPEETIAATEVSGSASDEPSTASNGSRSSPADKPLGLSLEADEPVPEAVDGQTGALPAPAPTAEPAPAAASAAPAVTPSAEAQAPATEDPTSNINAGYCRECGSPHPAGHAFCTNCGARLD
ncbi:MAG TPA: zinc-ribbon domain-containing protein [Dehalococcoidia bacterium]